MITAGIDCGSKNTKTILLREDQIISKAMKPTGFDQIRAIKESFEKALHMAKLHRKDIDRIGGTGAGKELIEFSHITINEIKAISKAANFFFPASRTVVDVGAEEARAAKIDENGNTLDFEINERCAAGAGTFIETMARALEVPLEEMGTLALKSKREIHMNAQCVIFAESEVVGLIHSKVPKEDISKAIHDAMANRIAGLIRRIGLRKEVVMMGGVAYNVGFTEAFKRELQLERLFIPDDPEYGGAVGAAILAGEALR